MNPYQLIDSLNNQNIFLSVKNDKLLINAPSGFLNKELIATIECSKKQIMGLIDMQNFLGNDLNLHENKEETLKSWKDFLQERDLIESGKVPPYFTAVTHCVWCGDVFVPPEIAAYGKLQGCMWCSNRLKKTPIPKPKTNIINNYENKKSL